MELVSGAVKRKTNASGPQEALESVARQTVKDRKVYEILGAINCKSWSVACRVDVFTQRAKRWILNGCQ
jgi:hypothetical protein